MNKRKKNSRQRGGHTHGCGSKKKARGSGNKGGAGMAGTGKRSDAKKPSIWKSRYFGKYGFVPKPIRRQISVINISHIDEMAENLVSAGHAIKKGDVYAIDAISQGWGKILGSGNVTKKFEITALAFSKSAKASIEKAGGKAIVLKKSLEKIA